MATIFDDIDDFLIPRMRAQRTGSAPAAEPGRTSKPQTLPRQREPFASRSREKNIVNMLIYYFGFLD